jgi:hypothetical protein
LTAAPEYFDRYLGDATPQPIPDEPTHCRVCTVAELEPLRRYAGVCKRCVMARMKPAIAPTTPLKSVFRVVRRFSRKRADGKLERYVEVRCGGTRGVACGRRRTLKATTWRHHRPRCCSACTLREIDTYGFEAEHGR